MNFGNLIIIVFLITYINYFLSFLDDSHKIKDGNLRMEKLRTIPLKSIEEQREFINLRYPKKKKFKFKWKMILEGIPILVMYYGLWRLFEYIFEYTQINIHLYQAISIIIVIPILLNMILKRYNLQKPDIMIFFR